MYCRECGEKLTLRFCENEGLIPYCAKCQAYMFPQFPIAVSMVVTNRAQDKILLAKHVEDDDFILFAGYVKKGETAERTIPREIKEELSVNIIIDTANLYGVFEAQAHGKAEGILVKMSCYTADFTGELQPASEISQSSA